MLVFRGVNVPYDLGHQVISVHSKTAPPSDPRNNASGDSPSHGPKVGGLTLTGALRQQVDLSDPPNKKSESLQDHTGSMRLVTYGLFTYKFTIKYTSSR